MRGLSIVVAVLMMAAPNAAFAKDGFENVSCSKPIPPALAGKHMSNGPVMATEAWHKDIALHDLGADEISDTLNTVSWSICGKEFMLLIDDKDIVRDVLPFPAHSKSTPEFSGTCSRGGRDLADYVVGVLDNTNTAADPLPAKSAWRIDTHALRFVAEPVAGLFCGRSGIVTVDGGM